MTPGATRFPEIFRLGRDFRIGPLGGEAAGWLPRAPPIPISALHRSIGGRLGAGLAGCARRKGLSFQTALANRRPSIAAPTRSQERPRTWPRENLSVRSRM